MGLIRSRRQTRYLLATGLRELEKAQAGTSDERNGAEMPRYRSHKTVHALKIAHVEDLGTDTTTDENPIVQIHFVNTGFAPIKMNLRGKPTPDVGWYYVVYEDGYTSFSPGQAFDDGYTLI